MLYARCAVFAVTFTLLSHPRGSLSFEPSMNSAGEVFILGFHHCSENQLKTANVTLELLSTFYKEMFYVEVAAPRHSTNFLVNITVYRMAPVEVELPSDVVQTTTGMGTNAILVYSPKPIEVTATVRFQDSAATFQPLPLSTLGSTYYVVNGRGMSWIMFIGVENEASATISFPEEDHTPNTIFTTKDGLEIKKGGTTNVTLVKFETYVLLSDQEPGKTLDGTRIDVEEGRYMAIISGSYDAGCHDPQAEFLYPTDIAGTTYIVPLRLSAVPSKPDKLVAKVVAIEPQTKILTSKNHLLQNAGSMKEIALSTVQPNSVVICDKPCLVVMLAYGLNNADASLNMVMPNERFNQIYYFLVPNWEGYTFMMILIGETNNDKLYHLGDEPLIDADPAHMPLDSAASWAKAYCVYIKKPGAYTVWHEQRSRKFGVYLSMIKGKAMAFRTITVKLERDVDMCNVKVTDLSKGFYTMECLGRESSGSLTLTPESVRTTGEWTPWSPWKCPDACEKTSHKIRNRQCNSNGKIYTKSKAEVVCSGSDFEVNTSTDCPDASLHTTCPTDCPLGFYGFNCTKKCRYKCVGRSCDKWTGTCTECRCGYENSAEHKSSCDTQSGFFFIFAFAALPVLLILLPGILGLLQDTTDLIRYILGCPRKVPEPKPKKVEEEAAIAEKEQPEPSEPTDAEAVDEEDKQSATSAKSEHSKES